MSDFLDDIGDFSENSKKVLLFTVIFLLFCFFAYLTVHFWNVIGTVVFFLTKLSFFLICFISAILALLFFIPACYAIGIYCILLIKFLKILFEWLEQLPERFKYELNIWKRIWKNRGFGKYSLFGGLTFYFKLRLRILAFLTLGLSIMLLSYGFYYKFLNYRRNYWHEKVFYGQTPQKIYTFLPNMPYTVKTNLMIYYMKLENSLQMVYFPIDEKLFLQHYKPIPNEWNITFTDTTNLSFGIYYFTSPSLSELFETTDFEIWENLSNGVSVDTAFFRKFTPPHIYEKNIRLTFPPHYWDE